MNLLHYKNNFYSQNGEDGIIEKIFSIVGENGKQFCEFGAWDGINLSNCRKLAELGWKGLFIECDKEKYKNLQNNYKNNPKIKCLNIYVDTKKNEINKLCKENGFNNIDFLSIDIDGLDYEIFCTLKMRPRLICVEVNAGHFYGNDRMIPNKISANNVGQPMKLFTEAASRLGYELVCYTGNAFYIREDLVKKFKIAILDNKQAYMNFFKELNIEEKEWLYLVNLGLVFPYYFYNNSLLSGGSLNILLKKRIKLIFQSIIGINLIYIIKTRLYGYINLL
jgi:hypothetical protein